MRVDYEYLKQYAKDHGIPTTDLFALAPNNDPFYCGQPRQVKLSEWFAGAFKWYVNRGIPITNPKYANLNKVVLRQMHYDMQGADPPYPYHDGTPYEHTDECFETLNAAGAYARIQGLVDPMKFYDGRNAEVLDFADYYGADLEVDFDYTTLATFSEPELDFPEYSVSYHSPQPYHRELWSEKSGPNKILIPLADEYKAVYQYGLGQLSWTIAIEAIGRIKKAGKPARIYYFCDHDEAGQSMPVAMARKLEWFLQSETGLDVKLQCLFLTSEQIEQFNLPLRNASEEKKRRSGGIRKFEEKHGGFVELDTMLGQHPYDFQRIVKEELDRYYDHELDTQSKEQRYEIEQECEDLQQEIYDRHQEEFDKLNELKELYVSLWNVVKEEMNTEMPEYSADDLPEAGDADEWEEPLYDSNREYFEQLAYYKEFQQKEWTPLEDRIGQPPKPRVVKPGVKLGRPVASIPEYVSTGNGVKPAGGKTKITMEIAQKVRQLGTTGMYSQLAIAQETGISQANVSKILNGKIWI